MAEVAAGATLAMSVGSTLMGAQGQSAGASAQKAKSQRAAAIARVQADEADAAYRDELQTTLSNIDAIRASAGMSQTSGTAVALRQEAMADSDAQRLRKVRGIKAQASQYDADARFYGAAARNYMNAGFLKAGGQVIGAASGVNFGSGGGPSGVNSG